jgi:hypothetical protein
MKHVGIASVALVLFAVVARAQERIEPEQALQIAKVLTEQASKEAKLPLAIEVDVEKPYGLKGGEAGAMIIPDKKLTLDAITKAGKDVTPVGHLWFRKVTPVAGGKPVPADKIRSLTVSFNGQDHEVTLYLVGVRKKDKLELVVLGKDKEPVLVAPLVKADVKQEFPLELEAKKTGEKMADLTLNLLSTYQVKIPVAGDE